MKLPPSVRIVEVGPRDGLQNEKCSVSVETKVCLIEALAHAGLRTIECGSFVSAKWVPQMADTATVLLKLRRLTGTCYTALVPNIRGFEQAVACGIAEVAVFVSASESFSKANLNCSIAESIRRAEEIVSAATVASVSVRGYISCVLGCPFEGEVAVGKVADAAKTLAELGCYEISLGDTIGVGTPLRTERLIESVASSVALKSVAVHFHDTWGQALANVLASLEMGVAVVDSSVSGLGGCPFAPGAAGNLATEDLVYMLDGLGIETGVDLAKVAAAGRAISSVLGRTSTSKAATAFEARLRSQASTFV